MTKSAPQPKPRKKIARQIDRTLHLCAWSNGEPVQILVIGSDKGVTNVIHSLYLHHFAQIHEWSKLMPAPVAGKRMRSLTRYVAID